MIASLACAAEPGDTTTVAKWRKCQTVECLKTVPREPRSTILTAAEKAAYAASLYALRHLTRSALHRCLARVTVSLGCLMRRGDTPKRQKFKRCPISIFHIDIAEVQTAEGKLDLFVGIGRTSRFAETKIIATADMKTAWKFLQHMLKAFAGMRLILSRPHHLHGLDPWNGIRPNDNGEGHPVRLRQPRNRNTIHSRLMRLDMIY